jgi:Ca2+-binding RTX toxin-like protein
VDRLIVDGGAGADRVLLAGMREGARVYGGDGNDFITGILADDILVGGAGDDRIAGGGGRDLLIGGTGADRIAGGAGDDALVSGVTAYDVNGQSGGAALENVNGIWSGSGDYASRVSLLTAHGVGPALTFDALAEDGSADVLLGQAGADAFFANSEGAAADVLPGRRSDETLIEL